MIHDLPIHLQEACSLDPLGFYIVGPQRYKLVFNPI